VQYHGINPNSILCVTFTNKAAEELKSRLQQLIGVNNPSWVRTIHSACLQMIKPYIVSLGYQDNFTITSMSKQKTIIRQVLKDMRVSNEAAKVNKVLGMISRCKDYPNPVKHLEANFKNIDMGKQIYGAYHELMRENNFLDFDDILYHAYWLIKTNAEFKQRCFNEFQYVLVDEYQDVNNIQYLLIKELGNNITVVGDDYQAIYAFRGSDPKYFINFTSNYEGAQTFKLEQNYRSGDKIVSLGQSIIKNNKNQIDKTCFSDIETKNKPKIVHFTNEYKEIAAIVKSCKRYIDEGFDLNDIAILYRIKMSSRVIETEFNRNKIPYKIVNDISFFERKEIKDLMSYLLFLYNYNDSISFERLVQSPRRGVGKKTIETIMAANGDTLVSKIKMTIAANTGKAYKTLNSIMLMFEKAHQVPFKDVLEFFIKESGFYKHLETSSDDTELDDRVMNVKELINMTHQYDDMISFLEDCALINPDDHVDEAQQITLMTIHAAKGLEFKVVFVIGLEEGTLPHYRSIGEAEESKNDAAIEEERRLFYVACTRAADVLNVSRCKQRGWMKDLKISRFISEIDKKLYTDINTLK